MKCMDNEMKLIDLFSPENPDDLIEVLLMNAARDYCRNHPDTLEVLESLKEREREEIQMMDELSQLLQYDLR